MRHLYLEVFWPESPLSNWRAFVSDHDETVYRKELGGNVSRYSPALWRTHFRFQGNEAVVALVSHWGISRNAALAIAACVVSGHMVAWEVELPKTWWS